MKKIRLQVSSYNSKNLYPPPLTLYMSLCYNQFSLEILMMHALRVVNTFCWFCPHANQTTTFRLGFFFLWWGLRNRLSTRSVHVQVGMYLLYTFKHIHHIKSLVLNVNERCLFTKFKIDVCYTSLWQLIS